MNRLKSLWPMPGGVEKYFDTLIDMLKQVRQGRNTREKLKQWLIQKYRAEGGESTDAYVRLPQRLGLYVQMDGNISFTEEGLSVLEAVDQGKTQDARAMVLYALKARVEGVSEILEFVGVPRTLDEIKANLKGRLGVEWQSMNPTVFRVNWLRSLGAVEKVDNRFRLADGFPPVEEEPGGTPTDRGGAGDEEGGEDVVARLSADIDSAAVAGGSGHELETAIGKAFEFLGFEVQQLGGAGNPDLVVTALMGRRSYRAVLDAKSRSSGAVNQNDVNFDALGDHKKQAQAQYCMVVGKSFAGGKLRTWAQEHRVRLVSTDEIIQILSMVGMQSGIPLDEFEQFFQGSGPTTEQQTEGLMLSISNASDASSLLGRVYGAVRQNQGESAPLTPESLYYVLGKEEDLEDIRRAVNILSSPLIGGIAWDESRGLYTRLSPRVLARRLSALPAKVLKDL